MGRRQQGSRYLYEPFDSAHARIETHERVFEERWIALNKTLNQIETGLERLERRLWIAVYSVAALLLGELVLLAVQGRIGPL
ncbi:MAG: hypothetical protein AAF401_15410 [Pseudomonadota bacterium]